MTVPSPEEWLQQNGVRPAAITAAHAQVDQTKAWVTEVAPIAAAARLAAIEGDWPQCLHLQAHVTEHIGELGIDPRSKAAKAIVYLLHDLSEAVAKLAAAGLLNNPEAPAETSRDPE